MTHLPTYQGTSIYIYVFINPFITPFLSVLCPILFQLASKGSPKSAKLAVRCLLSIYPDNTSNFERLYKVSAHLFN